MDDIRDNRELFPVRARRAAQAGDTGDIRDNRELFPMRAKRRMPTPLQAALLAERLSGIEPMGMEPGPEWTPGIASPDALRLDNPQGRLGPRVEPTYETSAPAWGGTEIVPGRVTYGPRLTESPLPALAPPVDEHGRFGGEGFSYSDPAGLAGWMTFGPAYHPPYAETPYGERMAIAELMRRTPGLLEASAAMEAAAFPGATRAPGSQLLTAMGRQVPHAEKLLNLVGQLANRGLGQIPGLEQAAGQNLEDLRARENQLQAAIEGSYPGPGSGRAARMADLGGEIGALALFGAAGGPLAVAGAAGGRTVGESFSRERQALERLQDDPRASIRAAQAAAALGPMDAALTWLPVMRVARAFGLSPQQYAASGAQSWLRRRALGAAVGGGSNILSDLGHQGAGIAMGTHGGLDVERLGEAGLIGAGAQTGLEVAGEGVYGATRSLALARARQRELARQGLRDIAAQQRATRIDSVPAPPSQPPQPHAPPSPSQPPTPPPPPTPAPPKVDLPARRPAAGTEFQPRPALATPAVEGRAARLYLADGTERAVRYDVVDAADLITTHNPEGFQPDPYGDANERAYEDPTEGRASRQTVLDIAKGVKPDLLLNTSPTPTDGPPITTNDYRVLGGNARAMGLKLAYSWKDAGPYRAALEQQAAVFGLDPERIRRMQAPILVRRMAGSPGKRGEASRLLNESLTTGKMLDTEAVSRGLLLEQPQIDAIASELGEGSLRDALANPRASARIIQQLVEAGALSPRDLVEYRNPDGGLNDAGKSAIERTLLGAAVADVRTLAQTAPAIRQKLLRALPALTRLRRSSGSDLDFQSVLGRTLDALFAYRESGARSMTDLIEQQSFLREPWREDPRAIRLAEALLTESGTSLAARLATVAELAERSAGGQQGFDFGQPRSAADAFDEVFRGAEPAQPSAPAGPDAPRAETTHGRWVFRQEGGMPRDPVTGEALTLVGFRGAGRTDRSSAYSAGAEGPVLGEGEYFAIDRAEAERYGPEIEAREITLRNPLVITNDRQLAELLGGQVPWSNEQMSRVLPRLHEHIRAGGHDGVVVNVPRADVGDVDWSNNTAKRLRSLFDVSQVFLPKAATSGASAPARARQSTEPAGMPIDVPGQEGLYGQGRVDSGMGRQQTLFGDAPPRAADDPMARRPGETDQEYRIRLRWSRPEVVEGTAPLFGEPPAPKAPAQPPPKPPPKAGPTESPTESPAGMPRGQGRIGLPGKGPNRGSADALARMAKPGPGNQAPLGGRTVLPEGRTVAQSEHDRPAAVREDIRNIRELSRHVRRAALHDGLVDREGRPVEPGVVPTIRESIQRLASALNVGRIGAPLKARRRNALGFAWGGTQDIRQRRIDDTSTAYHEIGHAVADVLFPDRIRRAVDRSMGAKTSESAAMPREWARDLYRLGKLLYGKRRPANGYTDEGWAELIRSIVENPAYAKKEAPTAFREATRKLALDYPDVWAALMRARAEHRLREQLGVGIESYLATADVRVGVESIGDAIRRTFRSARELAKDAELTFYRDFLDRYDALRRFEQDLDLRLPAHRSPHLRALRLQGRIKGTIDNLIISGPFDPADPTQKPLPGYKGLREILKPLEDAGELAHWQRYMVAKRVAEKRAQHAGLFSQMTEADVARLVERGNQLPAWRQAADEFQAFNEWMIRDFSVHHGMLTPEAAEKIIAANQDYITFIPVGLDGEIASRLAQRLGRGGLANIRKYVARFNPGTGQEIVNPLGAYMMSLQGMVAKAYRNEVARLVVRHAHAHGHVTAGAGRWLSSIDRPLDFAKMRDAEYRDSVVKQLGPLIDAIAEGGDEALAKSLVRALEEMEAPAYYVPSMRLRRADNEIFVWRNGKPEFYEVKDRRLYEAIEGLGSAEVMSIWDRMMAAPASTLRTTATSLNPEFFVTNFFRDMQNAIIMGESGQLKGRVAGAYSRSIDPFLRFLAGDVGQSDVHRMMRAAGVDMEPLPGKYVDSKGRIDTRAMFGQTTAEALHRGDLPEAAKLALAGALRLRMVGAVNAAIEATPRASEFEAVRRRAIAEGRSSREALALAGQAAADITVDFHRGGLLTKRWSRYVPFLNASVQGTYRLARFARQNPRRAMYQLLKWSVLPTIAAFIMNRDNPDYWERDISVRDRYFWFPIGAEDGRPVYLRIPKPYTTGLMSVATERALTRLFGIDPMTGRRGDPRAFRSMGNSFLRDLMPPMTVQMVAPIIETMAGELGWSFFWDKPIVPQRDRDLPSYMQGWERASTVARTISEWSRGVDDKGIAPAKVDYLLRSYFGGLGGTALKAIDAATKDDRDRRGAETTVYDWYLVRRFLATHTRADSEVLRRFYDDYEQVRGVHRLLGRLDPEKQKQYLEDNRVALARYNELNTINTELREIGSKRRALIRNTSIDGEELSRQLRELDERQLAKIRSVY